MKKIITANVPQGVGDIFWCYQKLSPYYDVINFNILVTAVDKVQLRSKQWLHIFPKVKEVAVKQIRSVEYDNIIKSKIPIKNILASKNKIVNYSCNKPLEEGIRLEDIDVGMNVEWSVPVKVHECPTPYKDYLCLYVSGSTKNPALLREKVVWGYDNWVQFIKLFYAKYKLDLPICMIGASFDKDVIETLQRELKTQNFQITSYIDSYPANVLHLIKNSKFFVGYQSGLNILADNLDTPQFMLYFHFLEKMQYTWCKKENIGTKFQANLFSKSPEEVVDQSNCVFN